MRRKPKYNYGMQTEHFLLHSRSQPGNIYSFCSNLSKLPVLSLMTKRTKGKMKVVRKKGIGEGKVSLILWSVPHSTFISAHGCHGRAYTKHSSSYAGASVNLSTRLQSLPPPPLTPEGGCQVSTSFLRGI